jgi:hypothetical protein
MSRYLLGVLGLLALGASSRLASAQCRPPDNSNEAKLLAFYSAPIVFSPSAAQAGLAPGSVLLEAEVSPIPIPSPAIQQTGFCYTSKVENTRLAPVFGRPRLSVGLPAGFVLEGSYVPRVRVWDADPELGSVALSRVQALPFAPWGTRVSLLLRAQGTTGSVRGPVTCPAKGLQTTDPTAPCYGTQPSNDTFHANMYGGEGALGLATRDGRWSAYAGGGVTWLQPRFTVGFTSGTGTVDHTRVIVDLVRGSVFGGVTAYVTRTLALSAQLYSVPADATTWRFGVGYRIR